MIHSDGPIIIAGGRDFDGPTAEDMMLDVLGDIAVDWGAAHVLCGMARGADLLAWNCIKRGYPGWPVDEYPADWEKYGKSAGYRRNAQMADDAEVLIAFWDGQSKGTRHMIELALDKGLEVHVIRYNKDTLDDCDLDYMEGFDER